MALALTAFTFTSCENFDLFDLDKEGYCDYVYPFDMVLPNDEVVSVNDEDEFDAVYEDWKTNNPNSTDEPTFSYPIQVIDSEGETITVNSDDELDAAFEDCGKRKGKCDDDCDDKDEEVCFDFVYPITMTMPDSTTITGDDEAALKTAIDNWYDANPTATDEPTFVYPIQLLYEDGTTTTINDEDELKTAYDACD